jgi:hypothetical protein
MSFRDHSSPSPTSQIQLSHVSHTSTILLCSDAKPGPGRHNAKQPALTAPVRAGAEVNTFWTAITRMHNGPALAYLAPNPNPSTGANDLKFFKIFEAGFIPSAGMIELDFHCIEMN